MPEFIFQFEVHCMECHTGLCPETHVQDDIVYINPCPTCMLQKDGEISALSYIITELENKIIDLENEIKRLNSINQNYE